MAFKYLSLLLLLFYFLCVDAQFFMKTKYPAPPQDNYTQESLDLTYHSLQLTQNQTALNDVVVVSGCGKDDAEDQDKSYSANSAKQINTNSSLYKHNSELIKELSIDSFFQRQKQKHISHTTPPKNTDNYTTQGNGNVSNSSLYKSPSSTLCSSCKITQYVSNDNPLYDNSTFYASCYDNNTCKSASYYSSANYENPPMHNNSEFTKSDTAYVKSSYCCTPIICEAIFQSLQKPNNSFKSQSQQDLIGNIQLSTPEQQNTPRKSRVANKSYSPYRTLSHFGFNSPQREPLPDHKHLPVMEPNKYIPLRRSISYEEIFSSPRYLDLCENCFEHMVRLKPELMQYRIKLRNLIEYQMPTPITSLNSSPNTKHDRPKTASDNLIIEVSNNIVAMPDNLVFSNLPLTEDDTHDEPYTIFSSQLEPVIEVEEKDSSEDAASISLANSTFIDKITRMNYSEESTNFNFINTPYTVTSQISLPNIEEDLEMESPTQAVINGNLNENFHRLNLNDDNSFKMSILYTENNDPTQESFASLTDIWEFANWLDHVMEQEPLNCVTFEGQLDNFDIQIDANAMTNKDASTSTSSINHEVDKQQERNLMNREERTRRKLEFQELWEDHVRCSENREQCYSDTESAIDETQHPNSPGLEIEQTEEMESDNGLENKEIFHGTSLVYSHASGANLVNRLKQISQENMDDVDYKSISSHHTYNVSEQNSSEENLLFRIPGSTNIVSDFSICETAGQINQLANAQCGSMDLDGEKSSLSYFEANNYLPINDLLEDNTEKYPHAISNKNFNDNNLDINITDSEMNIDEFDKIPQHEYNIHTHKSENFENILSEIGSEVKNYKQTGDSDVTKHQLEEKIIEVFKNPDDNKEVFHTPKEDLPMSVLEIAENDNETFKPTEESGDLLKTDIDIACHNITEPYELETDQDFSSLERKILEKIEINQLSKSEEIFDKIENCIRNKITPTKLELLIREQALRLCAGSDNDDSIYNLTSTPKKDVKNVWGNTYNNLKEDENLYRRSRSLTHLSDYSSPPTKLNQTSTPPMGPRKKQPESARSNPDNSTTPSPCSSKSSLNSNRKRRNFILENIRNASVPKNTPQIKRLQGNTQAIFGKNPFGPRVGATPADALQSAVKSPSFPSYKDQKRDGSNSAVYSFQSKLVRGSPKFWVSMTQSPNKKSQPKLTPSKVIRKCKRNSIIQEKLNNTVKKIENDNMVNKTSCLAIDSDNAKNIPTPSSTKAVVVGTDEVTKVDEEISALGEEIQQIQPRLETYKRKLDDFGDRVAKCARNMDECVKTQEEIFSEQRELKDRIVLHQFTEDITCRVHTFSLSETED